jgi:hypothetical protein
VSTWLAVESWNLALVVAAITTVLLVSIARARGGRLPRLRRIAGVAAIEEAVGRATEMGRPVVYVAGTQDLDEVQTVASLGILGAVGRMTARHGCTLIMPTDRSLVLAAARETLRESYTVAARPDAYNPDLVTYVSDDQFGFAARVDGLIARERPAACFLQGAFFAESLLIAEAGAQAGAVQVAGTAIPHQLPFLIAACDHVLIGEEFFAAEAYMSGEPQKIGSLRGQDVVKFAVMAVMVLGAVLVSLAGATGWPPLASARDGLLRLLKAS